MSCPALLFDAFSLPHASPPPLYCIIFPSLCILVPDLSHHQPSLKRKRCWCAVRHHCSLAAEDEPEWQLPIFLLIWRFAWHKRYELQDDLYSTADHGTYKHAGKEELGQIENVKILPCWSIWYQRLTPSSTPQTHTSHTNTHHQLSCVAFHIKNLWTIFEPTSFSPISASKNVLKMGPWLSIFSFPKSISEMYL